MSEDITSQYQNYSVYLPSLQSGYANYATKTNADVNRPKERIPKKFKTEFLNFFDTSSELWHCKYVLYSGGQFTRAQIPNRDIVAERDEANTIVVGDSGGFQLGTGAISNADEKRHLEDYKNDPLAQIENWQECDFRERTLRWLERYTDYAMTLYMVMWAAEEFADKATHAKDSQLRKLTPQQLIDLSVDNLKFFDANRGQRGRTTKFLNVLQDIGDGTGDAWYDAVKDFEFEGWAFGSETGGMLNSLQWFRRLLLDKKLDKTEWLHVLGKSPPVNSLVYTAAQRALQKVLGRDNLTISIDSSSPIQMGGKRRRFALPPNFTNEIASWKVAGWDFPQDIRIARNEIQRDWHFETPLSKFFTLHDLTAHDIDDSDYFTDGFSENCIINHNMWAFHQYAIQASQLMFDADKKDLSKIPQQLVDAVGLIEEFFTAADVKEIEKKLDKAFEPFKRKGKDTDNEEVDMR